MAMVMATANSIANLYKNEIGSVRMQKMSHDNNNNNSSYATATTTTSSAAAAARGKKQRKTQRHFKLIWFFTDTLRSLLTRCALPIKLNGVCVLCMRRTNQQNILENGKLNFKLDLHSANF